MTRSIVCEERHHVPRSQIWPGSRGLTHGLVHLHVMEPFASGRLKREVGECLCSKKRGSMERLPEPGEVLFRCEVCAARATRYGLLWPSAVAAMRAAS